MIGNYSDYLLPCQGFQWMPEDCDAKLWIPDQTEKYPVQDALVADLFFPPSLAIPDGWD